MARVASHQRAAAAGHSLPSGYLTTDMIALQTTAHNSSEEYCTTLSEEYCTTLN